MLPQQPPHDEFGRYALKEHTIRILTCIGPLVLWASAVGAHESTDSKQTEDWVYIQNADLRVGLLRSHGGAIAHLSSRTSDLNTLNHYYHGRLVQQSHFGDEDGSLWVEKP